MRFVIVSGMSGAGKSTALKVLEDFGFFCVDNLPVALLPNFGEIASDRQTEVDKVAVGVDFWMQMMRHLLKDIRKQEGHILLQKKTA